jgi:FtsZ-binding cell division protein ZapB
MNEQDYKYLLLAYQQKSFDMLSQTISLEAKVKQLSDLVQVLTDKVNELKEENEKLKRNKKTSVKEEYQ